MSHTLLRFYYTQKVKQKTSHRNIKIREYGINKPTRETIFSSFRKNDRYKSTVFIDTFTNRFGDATGGFLFNSLLSFGLLLYAAPLAIIPLAIFLINLGWSISKDIDPVNPK